MHHRSKRPNTIWSKNRLVIENPALRHNKNDPVANFNAIKKEKNT